jgi:methylthioribose-1-phosphate isomerase
MSVSTNRSVPVFSPLRWEGRRLWLIDQQRLPHEERWVECTDDADVAQAIGSMIVRGAPAIGCAAAFGLALAGHRLSRANVADFAGELDAAADRLRATRPTAVNLAWALRETRAAATNLRGADAAEALERRAIALWHDDIDRCLRIGAHGAALIADGATVLTHCNAGALATGGHGTALGVIRSAHQAGKQVRVLADETRPFLQGARLTAWELARDGIDVTLLPDVAAAWLLAQGEIACVIVGADRIAANADVANKIGTYGIALAAHAHDVPFYVAAPRSTIDLATPTGAQIPIEERSSDEVTRIGGVAIAPAGVRARHPAFDVTPARLIAGIITEDGVLGPPWTDFAERIRAFESRVPDPTPVPA